MSERVAEIAAGLTKAQRAALMRAPFRTGRGRTASFAPGLLVKLSTAMPFSLGLLQRVPLCAYDAEYRPTPLGLAVRDYLERQPK